MVRLVRIVSSNLVLITWTIIYAPLTAKTANSKNKELQKLSDIFTTDEMTSATIEETGLRAALLMYKAKREEDMTHLRH